MVIEVKELPDPHECWPEMEFDKSCTLLCMTWTTWPTNLDVTELPHYAIFDQDGRRRGSSDSIQDPDLVAKFTRLGLRLSHRELISYPEETNRFLASGRWAVAPDSSSFVRVLHLDELSDVVELWKLKPLVEKQWSWTRKGESDPPNCWLDYVNIRGKVVIAGTCGFSETVFLDAATGAQTDVVPFKQANEVYYGALSTCVVPERGWLICGTAGTKRIRVLSLDAPHRVLREVGNNGVNLFGSWSTDFLQAAAAGRLILKETTSSSRLSRFTRETEIYDTDTWKVIWKLVSHEAGAVVMSPDGKKIANRRGKVVEILPLTLK